MKQVHESFLSHILSRDSKNISVIFLAAWN